MKNILIVCADKDLRKDLAKSLATELKRLYLDADELLDFEILNRREFSLTDARDTLNKMEQETLTRVMHFKNCVITISHELFVSNDNFKILDNVIKVHLMLSKAYLVAKTKKADKHKLEQELCLFDEINKLASANCNICVSKDIKSIPEICQEIILHCNQIK